MDTIFDKRKTQERRDQVKSVPHDLRTLPDRRLNSISVQWIPIDEITLHSDLRKAFRKYNRALFDRAHTGSAVSDRSY